MTKILICVDGKSYKEIGERKFDAAMDWVDIILKKGPESLQEYSEVYFRAYGMDAFVIEGSVPDDVDVDALKRNLQDFLGEGMKPIIFMYIDKEDEE